MGHCGKFGYKLWATVADLVMRYGPLHGMRSYSTVKICDNFCAMGHNAGFGYPLWAVKKDLVKRYGSWRSIWLCDMGCDMGHSVKPSAELLNGF
jgi:hypothetical protein